MARTVKENDQKSLGYSAQEIEEIKKYLLQGSEIDTIRLLNILSSASARSQKELMTQFIEAAYRCLLLRKADPTGAGNFLKGWESGKLHCDNLLQDILRSKEFGDIALNHNRIAEAALGVALPLITGEHPSPEVLEFLGNRLSASRSS